MVFIIAEIGVNWDGNFDLAKSMMSKAKLVGCDAVKFQAFEESTVKSHPEKDRLIKSSINKDNIEDIDKLAKSIGIEWLCTPMYPDAVNLIEPYVQRFKIRLFDGRPILKNEKSPILERILKTNKPVIISCETSPKNCVYYEHPQISWLYCVPKYPCEFSDLDFSNFEDFDGYSNHCPHFLAPLASAILGANIIEVHVTSDKTKDYIDNSVSFDFNQLEELVRLVRFSEKIKH